MNFLRLRVTTLCLAALFAAPAIAADKITFATNWRAEAEHGGFYQAVADGTYARYGLEVTIEQGGPQRNAQLALASGRVDFALGANLLQSFDAVRQNVPIVAVAAMFQIDPVIFMSHPGVGLDRFEDLTKATLFVGPDLRASVFLWLKQAYGFKEENTKPYGFNSAPFLADKHSVQEGLLTSEPFEIERKGGFKPNVFLLPDYGYDSYSTLIEARADTIAKNPDLVRRFVAATAEGWRNYLHGDNKAANALIKRDNPEMSDAQIAFSIEQMIQHGVVEGGEAATQGIGVMTDAHVKSFFDKMAKAGVVPADLDYKRGYRLDFLPGAGAAKR